MKVRGLIVLSLVVATLGGFIFWVERELPTTEERLANEDRIILWETTQVDGLEILHGEERTLLRRTVGLSGDENPVLGTGEWSLQAPMKARADGAEVDALLAKLVALEKMRTLEDADRGELGLEPAELTFTLHQGEETETFEVGAVVPGSTNRILAHGGKILLVEGSFLDDVREPGNWRSKNLFPGVQNSVSKMEVGPIGRSLNLAKRDSTWWVETPLEDLADEDRVGQFLLALVGLQAIDFVDEKVEGEPVLSLRVSMEDREEAFNLDWNLGGAEEAPFLVRVGDQVVLVENTLGEYLKLNAEAWRSRAWIRAHTYAVESFQVNVSGETLSFEKVEGAWMKGEEEHSFADVSDFFFSLTEPRAEAVLPIADFVGKQKILSVNLVTSGATEIAELYEGEDGSLLTTSVGREVALRMPPELKGKVFAALEALRKPVEATEEPVLSTLSGPSEVVPPQE